MISTKSSLRCENKDASAISCDMATHILPGDIADAIRGLWCDPGIYEAVNRSCKFQLNNWAVYYFAVLKYRIYNRM
jgi:hypothetical protein